MKSEIISVFALVVLLAMPVVAQDLCCSALTSEVGRENARAMGQPEVPREYREPTITVHDGGLRVDPWAIWRMWTCMVFRSWITGCAA